MDHRERLKQLLREKSLIRGRVVLSSGQVSDYYLDCKLTTLDPEGAVLTGYCILELLRSIKITADAIGGLSMGADPIVSATVVVSHFERTPLAGFLIRKERKQHGRERQIEGIDATPKRVVILDEVCTTGAATQAAIDVAEKEGHQVVAVISLVDREEGGSQRLALKYNYHSVFTARELLGDDERSADATSQASPSAHPGAPIRR